MSKCADCERREAVDFRTFDDVGLCESCSKKWRGEEEEAPAKSVAAVLALAVGALVWALHVSGCVAIVNYAPNAEHAAFQIHSQVASNMVVNETVPIEPRLANELTGAVGAQIKDNTVKGVETTTTIKAK